MTAGWRRAARIGGCVAAVLIALLLVAAAYDREHRHRLLPGVTIDGVEVGGREEGRVAQLLRARVASRAGRTVVVRAGLRQEVVSLDDLGVGVDTDAVLRSARGDANDLGLVSRVWHRASNRPVRADYSLRLAVDRSKVEATVAALVATVDVTPSDAAIDTSSGFVVVTPAIDGRALDRAAAARELRQAAERLANAGAGTDSAAVDLPVRTVTPAVRGFAHVLLVRLGENQLYHYVDGALAKAYPVATGLPKYPTPEGRFTIIEKRRNPTWINPDPTGWGKDLPARIGPGSKNPLGTRALRLNLRTINIHGTSNVRSLGYSASHGCVRMSIPDSEELFELVPVGTPVVILSAGPPRPPGTRLPADPLDNPNVPIDLAGRG